MNSTDTIHPPDGCPAPEILTAFQLGALPSDQLETIAEHLHTCTTCESLMVALAVARDPLVSSLRALAGSGPLTDDPQLRFEMSTLQQRIYDLPDDREADLGLSRVGEYQLLERLGEGSMGVVHRALHTRLNKVVALKVLRDVRGRGAERLARFQREMRAAGQLRHPNIVEATDAGEDRGTHFLVLEFVEGTDLGRLVQRHGMLPVPEACELIRQAAVGLHHAHQLGLVHRDVKPSNLMLSVDGQVKLADLGLVGGKTEEVDGLATSSDCVLGSLEYMAPEQADDPHRVDARADLYSLGCTLYHLLAGRPPFADPACRTVLQKLKAHATTPVPPLAGIRSDVPPALARLVEKLLAKRPGDRFASAAELAEALRPFCVGADLRGLLQSANGTTVMPRPTIDARKRGPRWPLLVAALLGGVALLALAAGVIYVQTDNGLIEIKTEDDDVKVSVEKGGKEVAILDGKTKKEVRLSTAEYHFKILSGGESLELKPASAILKRGDTVIVTVKRIGGVAVPVPVTPGPVPPLNAAWVKKVASLEPAEQADAVLTELKLRNPGFTGTDVKTGIDDGKLHGFIIYGGSKLTDITPLKVLPHLRNFAAFNSELADLSPFKGMKLIGIDLVNARIVDLSPLKGMQLEYLNLHGCGQLKDLSPLAGQPLHRLDISGTNITDLTPLATTELEHFSCAGTKVKDLGPLANVKTLKGINCTGSQVDDLKPLSGLKLQELHCAETFIKSLTPLKGMSLLRLNFKSTAITDLSPLKGMALEELNYDLDKQRDFGVLQSLKSLKQLNGQSPADLLQ